MGQRNRIPHINHSKTKPHQTWSDCSRRFSFRVIFVNNSAMFKLKSLLSILSINFNFVKTMYRVKLCFSTINGSITDTQFHTELMDLLSLLSMELKPCLWDLSLQKVFTLSIQDIWNTIQNIPKFLVLQLLSKTQKCSEECKIEDKTSPFISSSKLNLFLTVILTTLFSKLKGVKNPMRLSLLVATLTLGIPDHKPEPMMMEEDLSVCLKLSECWKDLDSSQEEQWDLSHGVVRSLAVREMVLLNTSRDISTKLTSTSLLSKVI